MPYSLLPIAPPLGLPAAIVVALTAAYLGLASPILGRRIYRGLAAGRDTDPTALVIYYRRNVVRKWLWTAPVVLAFIVWPGLRPAQLGLSWPHGALLAVSLIYVAILALGLVGSAVVMRRRVHDGRTVVGLRRLRSMAPRTRTERAWMLAAFASASIVEELVVRGLLLAAGLAAGLPALAVILITSALFGLAHAYQGTGGVILTGVLGLLFAGLVLLTGSLLLPIILHAAVSLRALIVLRAAGAVSAAPAPSSVPAVEESFPAS
jgi:membrane protease YdiL (CAAX protease family)